MSTPARGIGRGRGPARRTVLSRELADLLAHDGPGRWVEQAACRDQGADPEPAVRNRHYPTATEDSSRYREQTARALTVCAWCPVRADCLAHALAAGEDEGIWGGTTPDERRHLRASEKGA